MRNSVIQVLKKSNSNKQLIMLPFAGGHGKSYLSLSEGIKEDIEIVGINPPGSFFCNKNRMNRIESLANLYLEELRPILKEEIIIFGHSMGGAVAYEFLNSIKDHEIKKIKHVFLTGAHPPHTKQKNDDLNSKMNNNEIIAKCIEIGGFPKQLKFEKEFCDVFCKMMKTDLEALENYEINDSHKLIPIPATICWGKEEELNLEEAEEWNRYFKIHELKEFAGDHFFIMNENNKLEICKMIENLF
ncbi:MAG: hypothetical protein GQ534_00070 [Candidatus Delongbacteria bacterium]|nr:hypothetical protein [Candidatus Delongbacteria bacterium]